MRRKSLQITERTFQIFNDINTQKLTLFPSYLRVFFPVFPRTRIIGKNGWTRLAKLMRKCLLNRHCVRVISHKVVSQARVWWTMLFQLCNQNHIFQQKKINRRKNWKPSYSSQSRDRLFQSKQINYNNNS